MKLKLDGLNLSRFAPMALAMAMAMAMAAVPAISGNIVESSVSNGDGSVTYSYLVDNTGGSFDVAGWSLEFGFSIPDWIQSDTANHGDVTVANANWFADKGTPVTGDSAQDFISLSVDGDVKVGTMLGGFSFTSKFLPGLITFEEFSADGGSIVGTTVGPISSVPDNGPIRPLLVATAVSFMLAIRKEKLAC
jgi:hypothetical protein